MIPVAAPLNSDISDTQRATHKEFFGFFFYSLG